MTELAGHRPDLTTLLHDVIGPVMNAMTKAGELEHLAVGFEATQDANGHAMDTLIVRATLCHEVAVMPLWSSGEPRASGASLRKRMASDLQDFISESRFAWGELRPNPFEE